MADEPYRPILSATQSSRGRPPGHPKTGGRQKGSLNKSTRADDSPFSALEAAARAADKVEQKAAKARAARRRATSEYKAAAKVLTPTLTALKAAVAALEALLGLRGPMPVTRDKSPQHQAAALAKRARKRTAAVANNGATIPATPPEAPPIIRTIKDIVAHDGVTLNEAKRIQEQEILARAEWRPAIIH
jgi:hypothetical protein